MCMVRRFNFNYPVSTLWHVQAMCTPSTVILHDRAAFNFLISGYLSIPDVAVLSVTAHDDRLIRGSIQ